MRSLVLRLRWGFSESISAKLAAKRNAVRFEAQNIDWTFQELQHYSDAVARGLWSLGLRKGDRLMLKLPRKLQAESAATRLGAAKLGAEVKASRATTLGDFSTELKESKAQGLIFDPSLQLDNSTLGSSLNQVFPKLHQLLPGQPFHCDTFTSLKFVVQTGFYTLPGVLKYHNILNYAQAAHAPFEAQQIESYDLPNLEAPIIVLEPSCATCFKGGLANAAKNGRFVIYAEKEDLKPLLENFPTAQVISNNDVQGLPPTATLVTAKKRNIQSSHPKRLEV